LRLALGTSMGAMQCWVWRDVSGLRRRLVPLASAPCKSPAQSRHAQDDRGQHHEGPGLKNGDYTEQPRAGLVGAIIF